MLFDSLDFALFLPVVFAIYWILNKRALRWQNVFLLLASYTFYGWWDWRFLVLILLSTIVDYFASLGLSRKERPSSRKALLWLSLSVNLGLLGFFKYANFFIDSFAEAFTFFGFEAESTHLNIILPVGISFYTFQTISYTVDIYKRKFAPTKDFIAFAGFVSFFPQLVAGPIERARHLLPQFQKSRVFNYDEAVHGLRQMLWGLFKKVVIANNCAVFVDQIFGGASQQSGINLFFGLMFFTFQAYADFSGYSDIAIGTARLFGFKLKVNFAYPFFSRNMVEFWRRWHISLMTWFRDYVYIPLGGSKSKASRTWNTLIVFFISGLWHGANFTFICWGLLQAIFCLLVRGKTSKGIVDSFNVKTVGSILLTNLLFMLSIGFFRAGTMEQALVYYSGLFDISLFAIPDFSGLINAAFILLVILAMLMVEWKGRYNDYGISHWANIRSTPIRWSLYAALILGMGLLNMSDGTNFIYFQF